MNATSIVDLAGATRCQVGGQAYRDEFVAHAKEEWLNQCNWLLAQHARRSIEDVPLFTLRLIKSQNTVRFTIASEVTDLEYLTNSGNQIFRWKPSGSITLHSTKTAIGRRCDFVDLSMGERLTLKTAQQRALRGKLPSSLVVDHILPLSGFRFGEGARWQSVLALLSSSCDGTALEFQIWSGIHNQIDRVRLESSVRHYSKASLDFVRPGDNDPSLDHIRTLLIEENKCYRVDARVYGDEPGNILTALNADSGLDIWLEDSVGEDQFAEQLSKAWLRDELTDMLLPPYSTKAIIPGISESIFSPIESQTCPVYADPVIELGTDISSGDSVGFIEKRLTEGLGVFGSPGSGKSTTVRTILEQAVNLKKQIMICDPAGDDYGPFVKAIGGVVFNADNPIKFNAFLPERNTCIYEHCKLLGRALAAARPTSEFGVSALEHLFCETYYGHIAKIVHGENGQYPSREYVYREMSGCEFHERPALLPTLTELFSAYRPVLFCWLTGRPADSKNRALSVTQEETMASVWRRLEDLLHSSFGSVFRQGQELASLEGLLKQNCVIETRHLSSQNEAAALFSLLIFMLHQHRKSQGSSGDLKHILVLEEAHNLMPKTDYGNMNDAAQGQQALGENITKTILECRKYGQSSVVVDQSTSLLRNDALAGLNHIIAHRSVSGTEKRVIADSLALSAEQQDYLGYLKPGQAIVGIDGLLFDTEIGC